MNAEREELNELSMNMIVQSGQARTLCMQALDLMATGDLDMAKKLLAQAEEEVISAHRIHTDILQPAVLQEDEGNPMAYSMLFAHAQDTMMTITTEINIAKKMLCILVAYEKRLQALES